MPSRSDVARTRDEQVRRRRSRKQVDGLIIDAARAVFAEKGYSGTTMREIADGAGVYEPMVYRRFQSKADLFEAAVLAPFNEVISSYLATWEAQADAPGSVEDLVRAFVEPLYTLLSDHRDLALALVASRDFRPEAGHHNDDSAPPMLASLLDRMEPQLEIEAVRRPLRVDSPATVHVTVAMILGMALLDERALTSRDGRLSRRRLVEEMVNMILYGVLPRDGSRDESTGPGAASAGPTAEITLVLLDRVADLERRAIRAELEAEQLAGQRASPRREGKRVTPGVR